MHLILFCKDTTSLQDLLQTAVSVGFEFGNNSNSQARIYPKNVTSEKENGFWFVAAQGILSVKDVPRNELEPEV